MKALVLSGGGVKGAYQVGVLKYLLGEKNTNYDIICGVSVGALNAAGLCNGKKTPAESIEWLENFWLTQICGNSSIYKRWFPFGKLHSLWKQSIYNSSPLSCLIEQNLSIDAIRASGKQIAIGAVCIDNAKHYFATQDSDDFHKWVLASSSFPCFFLPIEIDGKLWSDGGIINVTPLGQAIRMGAAEIDVIMCSNPWNPSSWTSKRKTAIPDQLIRTLTLMSEQIMRVDINVVGLKNDLATINQKYKIISVNLIMPESELTNDSLEFNPAGIREMIDIGYKDAFKIKKIV